MLTTTIKMMEMTRIKTGWLLTKKSWQIIRKDHSLLWFPILSASSIVCAAIIIFSVSTVVFGTSGGASLYIIAALFAYLATTLAVYFNVALAACASLVMEGEDTNIRQGLRAANQRIHAILAWALLAATVGLVLKIIAEQFKMVGEVVSGILGAGWAVASFFAIPVLALEGHGPIATLKRSVVIVRQRWGEGVTGYIAISLITLLMGISIAALTLILAAVAGSTGVIALSVIVISVGAIGLISLTILSTALTNVFRVAVYRYALTKQAQATFTTAELETAFQEQKRL